MEINIEDIEQSLIEIESGDTYELTTGLESPVDYIFKEALLVK